MLAALVRDVHNRAGEGDLGREALRSLPPPPYRGGGSTMSITTSRFTNEKALCGSVSSNVVRHDGTVLEDEIIYGQ